jgi:hypothetical protein
MFRIILSFILIVFLYAGLVGTANVFFKTSEPSDKTVITQLSERKDKRLSIKEIETITSSNNYSFTSANALR